MNIFEKFTDEAGKARFLIEVQPNEIRMLKFDNEITDEEAIAEMQRIIDNHNVISK